jgi:hypothetical protein
VEENHGVSTLHPTSPSNLGFLLHCTLTDMFPFELCIKGHSALFMLRLLKVPKCEAN